MININREHYIYKMSKENEPVAKCQSGDIVAFHTFDCYSNRLLPKQAKLGIDTLPLSNPATGPLYVEGAMPGDTLKVEIIDISVGALGINIIGPSCNCFNNKFIDYVVNRIPIVDGEAKLFDNLSIPIEPMIGVIGVAPLDNAVSTSIPGNHGGNMDCSQIKKGAVLYLPVLTEGALLAIGDMHALMGDGEIGENGLEIEGTAIVRVSVLHGITRKAPIVCVDSKWITIATSNTLDEASEDATSMMLDFLIDEVGMEANQAGVVLNVCGNLIICQKCNRYKTIRMELPLSCLTHSGFIPA